MAFAEYLLSFWESGILAHARQRVPMRPAPNKNPGHCVSNEFLGRQHFTRVVTTCCWWFNCFLCDSTGRALLEALHNFLWPLLQFCFDIFAVTNHSHEYGFLLSPMSPPSKSSNLGVALGTLTQFSCCWNSYPRVVFNWLLEIHLNVRV